MSVWTCPKCKKELSESSHYFCTSCGAKLPEDKRRPISFQKASARPLGAPPKGSSLKSRFSNLSIPLNKKLLLEVGAIVLIVGLIFGVRFFVDYYKPTVNFLNESVVETTESTSSLGSARVLTSSKQYNQGGFKNNTLRYYIPSNVDLYIEVHDPRWLSSSYESFFADLTVGFSALRGPLLIFSVVEDSEETQWGFVARLVDKIPAIKLEEPLKFRVVEGVVVVASSEDLLDAVTRAHSGIIKNITRNPKFMTAVRQLPSKGQIMINFLTYEGRKSLEDIRYHVTNNDTKDLINRVLDFGYSELVIR